MQVTETGEAGRVGTLARWRPLPSLKRREALVCFHQSLAKWLLFFKTNLEVWILWGNVLVFQILATNYIIKECAGQLKHVYRPCLVYNVPSGLGDFFTLPSLPSSPLGHDSLPLEIFLWCLLSPLSSGK